MPPAAPPPKPLAPRALVTWTPGLHDRAVRYVRGAPAGGVAGEEAVALGTWGGVPVTLVDAGPEGPTSRTMTWLAESGVRAVVGVGTAESIHPFLGSGSLVVVLSAEAAGPGGAAATEALRERIEAGVGEEGALFQCGVVGPESAGREVAPDEALALRKRGCHALAPGAARLLQGALREELAVGAVVALEAEHARLARLDEPNPPGGLVWERRVADPGTLEGPLGQALRGALAALTAFPLD